MVAPSRRTTSVEIPASDGEQGPGEMMMCDGAIAATSSTVRASFRCTDRRLAQLTDVAGQVVDERVVVVEQENHGRASAPISALALSRVSRYSSSGSESATMPPPAWKYTRPRRAR